MADRWQRTQRTNRTGKKLTKSKDLTKEIADDGAWHTHGLRKRFTSFGVHLVMVVISAAVLVIGGTGISMLIGAILAHDQAMLNGVMSTGWDLARDGAFVLLVGQGIIKKKE